MKKIGLLSLPALLLLSCSLKYSDTADVDDIVPELSFTNTTITRYEDDRVTVEMSADSLEQYKDSSESYAKNLSFTAYDSENEISTKGSCGYLFADTSKELYELFNGIELYNYSDKTNFFADTELSFIIILTRRIFLLIFCAGIKKQSSLQVPLILLCA